MRKHGLSEDAAAWPPANARRAAAASQPTLRDFSQSLPMSLLRAREAVMAHFRQHLHGVDLTEQQWRVLRALMGTRSMEVQALADAAFLLGPSLSRILKDLEARGFVLRRVSEKDMRRRHISISQSGRQLVEESGVESEAIYAEITHRYGAEKLARLQAMLRDLESVLAAPLFDVSKPDKARRQSANSRAKGR